MEKGNNCFFMGRGNINACQTQWNKGSGGFSGDAPQNGKRKIHKFKPFDLKAALCMAGDKECATGSPMIPVIFV